MKVLISWSGELSHQVALALRKWLPMFIQAVRPWVSSEDIAKGTLWRIELAKELEEGSAGILCITRDNVGSPWVNYEAGALGKTPGTSRVIPFLFEMRPSDVHGPLADLQGAMFERGSGKNQEEFRKLLVSLNTAQTPPCAPEAVLNTTFEKMWPDFAPVLEALAAEAERLAEGPAPEAADPSVVLEEVLQAVRDQSRIIGNALGDRRWTFRGNARLDPLSRADYRQIAMGLEMLKTLTEIDEKGYYHPPGSTLKTMLMLRDPLEVLLGRAYAPLIHSVYFTENPKDPDGPWTVTYSEDEPHVPPWDRTTLTEEDFAEALEADRSAEADAHTPTNQVPVPTENGQNVQESPDE
jgi:TIR domain